MKYFAHYSGSRTQGKINFLDAVSNRDLRQPYLDQLVQREQCPDVDKVVYDDDKRVTLKALGESVIARRAISREELTQILGRELQSIADCTACTLPPSEFGLEAKSNVYVFRDAFETSPRLSGIQIATPSEERLRTLLQHEYQHAEDSSHGINNSNYKGIDPEVLSFIGESRAYLRAIKFSRQFGGEHPKYLLAIREFWREIMKRSDSPLAGKTLSPYDRQLYETQLKTIKDELDEGEIFRSDVYVQAEVARDLYLRRLKPLQMARLRFKSLFRTQNIGVENPALPGTVMWVPLISTKR